MRCLTHGQRQARFAFGSQRPASIPAISKFAYAFGVFLIFNLVDLLIPDWLIVCWLKPHWVILAGTEHIAIPNPYLHHFKEFLMGTAGLGIVSLAIAALLSIK